MVCTSSAITTCRPRAGSKRRLTGSPRRAVARQWISRRESPGSKRRIAEERLPRAPVADRREVTAPAPHRDAAGRDDQGRRLVLVRFDRVAAQDVADAQAGGPELERSAAIGVNVEMTDHALVPGQR